MNAMVATPATELRQCRFRLATGPAAAGEARRQVLAAIREWGVQVDADVAVLLTSELVNNAIAFETDETITLGIRCPLGGLRVDVHDTSLSFPVVTVAAGDAETGRGLMLVAALAAEWGFYRTPGGKAVYFALLCSSDRPASATGSALPGFPMLD